VRATRSTTSRPGAPGSPVERTAIALVLIVFGSVALITELFVEALGGSSGGDTVVLVLLLALLPVLGAIILLVGDRGSASAAPRRPEHHAGPSNPHTSRTAVRDGLERRTPPAA
jgi:hypothetical protein